MKTTKYLLAAIMFLTGVTLVSAQANFGEFKWGLKGGANFANINNLEESIEDKKGKVGITAGAFFKIPLNHYMSIRPELLFNMKGASFDVSGNTPDPVRGKLRLNYVEVPLSLDFDLPFFIDFHAGVQGAFLIDKSFDNIEIDDDFIQKGEFGFHVGGGIDLGNIGMHVRFQQSLTSFTKDQPDFDPRNWGLSLTGAYMFP